MSSKEEKKQIYKTLCQVKFPSIDQMLPSYIKLFKKV